MTTCDACSVSIDGYDADGTSVTPVGVTVTLCDLHAAAEDMLACVKALSTKVRDRQFESSDPRAVEAANDVLTWASDVITRSEGRKA